MDKLQLLVLIHCVRVANTLLKYEESACNFANIHRLKNNFH